MVATLRCPACGRVLTHVSDEPIRAITMPGSCGRCDAARRVPDVLLLVSVIDHWRRTRELPNMHVCAPEQYD